MKNDMSSAIVSSRKSEEALWFEEFVSQLNSGIGLEVSLLDQQLKTIIASLMEKDTLSILSIIREESEKYYAKRVVLEFWNATYDIHHVIKTAFDFYGKGLHIWIEVNNDSLELEQRCASLVESLRKSYIGQGLDVTGFVVEVKDGLRFPPEYVSA